MASYGGTPEIRSATPAFISHERSKRGSPMGQRSALADFDNETGQDAAATGLSLLPTPSPEPPPETLTPPPPASSARRGLTDCCYSLANLALIIGSLVALVNCGKFMSDDSLYEYGEHVLSLRFYRQTIYTLIILPLVLLVPIFNAASAFFVLSSNDFKPHRRPNDSSALLTTKIVYQLLMGVLVFIGLAFVAPTVRLTGVQTSIDYELQNHMRRRYSNDFSFEFLDRIQQEYQCCDVDWYRANYQDRMPLTCFVPDGQYMSVYTRTCAEVIGQLVSTRCALIAICLVIILAALASLLAIEAGQLLSNASARHYNVAAREAEARAKAKAAEKIGPGQVLRHTPTGSPVSGGGSSSSPDSDCEGPRRPYAATPVADSDQLLRSTPPVPLKVRAATLGGRPQSPLFVGGGGAGVGRSPVPRGVLKKGGSYRRVHQRAEDSLRNHDDEPEEEEEEDDEDDDMNGMDDEDGTDSRSSRGAPTRRSLLSVRFADDAEEPLTTTAPAVSRRP